MLSKGVQFTIFSRLNTIIFFTISKRRAVRQSTLVPALRAAVENKKIRFALGDSGRYDLPRYLGGQ